MKLLVIATQLPPYIGSGNVRALNYINYLSRLGHQVDVIGVDYPKDSVAYDIHLENSFDEKVTVNRIKPGYFYRFFYRKKSHETARTNNGNTSINSSLKGKINSFIKKNFVIPDAFVLWIFPAYGFGKNLIKKNDYDVIFTLHETPSSHIVGYLIKRKFKKISWVSYWSDPWNGDSLREERSYFKKFIEERLEKLIVKESDKLLFTTEKTKSLYKENYKLDDKQVSLVYRGYDKDFYLKVQKEDLSNLHGIKNDKFNIIHIGTIYKKLRDVEPLCNALNNLKKNDFDLYQKLNILFIGQFDNIDDQKQLLTHEVVSILPLIPYEDALRYTVKADALLLYGNKNSTQIPGKVYEYLGSKAVIMTLYGDPNDELRKIMEDVKKGPIIENNKEEIYLTLKDIIKGYNKDNINSIWKETNLQYEWENVVKDLEYKIFN